MARVSKDHELRKYAVMGAQARLAELRAETQFILNRFPELSGAGAPSSTAATSPAVPSAAPKPRWEMSPEARKAVSERMRKYWAGRRRAKAAAAKAARA